MHRRRRGGDGSPGRGKYHPRCSPAEERTRTRGGPATRPLEGQRSRFWCHDCTIGLRRAVPRGTLQQATQTGCTGGGERRFTRMPRTDLMPHSHTQQHSRPVGKKHVEQRSSKWSGMAAWGTPLPLNRSTGSAPVAPPRQKSSAHNTSVCDDHSHRRIASLRATLAVAPRWSLVQTS